MQLSPNPTALAATIIVFATASHTANGMVTEYFDKAGWTDWQVAAKQWTTIGFTDLPFGTVVIDQYAHLGVTFPEGDDSVFVTNSFEDGYGLKGSFALDPDDSITVEFSQPQYAIGVDFPGGFQMELYQDDLLLHTTQKYASTFMGVASTTPFNRARIFDPFGFIFIDDLHFGGVPAPSALPLLGALLIQSRRRRS